MITFNRKHTCPCGKVIKKDLPVEDKDPRVSQFAHVWLRTWLKLKNEKCNACFLRDATDSQRERFRTFEQVSRPHDIGGLLRGLQYLAANHPDAGIVIEKENEKVGENKATQTGAIQLQFPEDLLESMRATPVAVEALVREIADASCAVKRIAAKLDSFTDFSNVMCDEDEEDEPDLRCPTCGKDDKLFESLKSAPGEYVKYYCMNCDTVADYLDDVSTGAENGEAESESGTGDETDEAEPKCSDVVCKR